MSLIDDLLKNGIDYALDISITNDNLFLEIGFIIKEGRKRLKVSQSELSHMCGITQGNISRIEKGKMNFSIKQLIKILNALKIRINLEIKND